MDVIESYYGKEIFMLYALFANVPGKKIWPRKIFVTFSVLMLFMATFCQVQSMLNEKFQRKVVIELLPTTVSTAGSLIYISYVYYATGEEYKVLLSLMLKDLKEERTEEENEIKRKYAQSTRIFTNAFLVIFASTMCGIPLSGFIPYFLDLLLPLNETRERRLLVPCEGFFDQRTFFYGLYFIQSIIVCIVCIVVGVTENMGVVIGFHTCSMIAVIGHRLENLISTEDHKVLRKSDFMELVTRRVREYIVGHQRSMRYAVLMAEFYDFPLTLVLLGTFSALSISLVQGTDPELTNGTIIFYTIVQVFQLFVVSYLGQVGIDSTKQISVNVYNSGWYLCTPRVRRFLQMTILRSSKPFTIIIRGMYMLSMESFMAVMQTVASFYMVLRQTQ